MRIVAGQFRGRQLKSPNWEGLRPTSDRLRETLFNVIAPRIEDARFLDLCAGSGAVGIEALSRGASPPGRIPRRTSKTGTVPAVARAVQEVRKGTLSTPDRGLQTPRQK